MHNNTKDRTMNQQQLHIIDTGLELLMTKKSDENGERRRLKNAIYECIRCFHGGEVWGEPYHIAMIEDAVTHLSNLLKNNGTKISKEDTTQ